MPDTLTARQRQILECIVEHQNQRGYPPSVREIGEAVGLKSPATVKSHLDNLKSAGYLVRDPAKPRAIQVRYDGASGANVERRPVRHVPLVGDVAAGTDVLATENIEEVVPMPADLTGDGETDGADLAELLSVWGQNAALVDFNADGIVDGADLAQLLAAWGPCP